MFFRRSGKYRTTHNSCLSHTTELGFQHSQCLHTRCRWMKLCYVLAFSVCLLSFVQGSGSNVSRRCHYLNFTSSSFRPLDGWYRSTLLHGLRVQCRLHGGPMSLRPGSMRRAIWILQQLASRSSSSFKLFSTVSGKLSKSWRCQSISTSLLFCVCMGAKSLHNQSPSHQSFVPLFQIFSIVLYRAKPSRGSAIQCSSRSGAQSIASSYSYLLQSFGIRIFVSGSQAQTPACCFDLLSPSFL